MAVRTITLTGRRPVRIVEEDWPVIAQHEWIETSSRRPRSEDEAIAHADGLMSLAVKARYTATVRSNRENHLLVYAAECFDEDEEHEAAPRRAGQLIHDGNDAILYKTMELVLVEIGQGCQCAAFLASLEPVDI